MPSVPDAHNSFELSLLISFRLLAPYGSCIAVFPKQIATVKDSEIAAIEEDEESVAVNL